MRFTARSRKTMNGTGTSRPIVKPNELHGTYATGGELTSRAVGGLNQAADRQRYDFGHIVIVKSMAQLQHRRDAFQENTPPRRLDAFGAVITTSSCSSLNEITVQLRYHGCDGSSGWPDVLHPRISPPSSSTTCAHCAQRDTNPREYKVGSGSLEVSASVCSSSASSKATTASTTFCNSGSARKADRLPRPYARSCVTRERLAVHIAATLHVVFA